jgi:predicted porin
MRKIVSLLAVMLLAGMLISSVCLASPLTNYSLGKTAVDIDWYPSLKADINSQNKDGKSNNIDWGITTGLGHNFALQYSQFNPETKYYAGNRIGVNTQQVNVLYKLDNTVSAFTGWNQAKLSSVAGASNQNTLQIGLIGDTQLATNTRLYGLAGFGRHLFNSEAGVSYEFAKATELNLFYRYTKINHLQPDSVDTTFKGVGLGLTYTF